MRIGRLRHYVTLQRDAGTTNTSYGEPVTDWIAVADVYAAIEPLNSREFFNAVQVQSNLTHKVTFRFRSDLSPTAKYRIEHGSRYFHLDGPLRNIDERNAVWEAFAVEVV